MHRLLLSGTPVQNNLGELWALVRFVCGQLHSKPRAGNGKGSSGGGGGGDGGCVLGGLKAFKVRGNTLTSRLSRSEATHSKGFSRESLPLFPDTLTVTGCVSQVLAGRLLLSLALTLPLLHLQDGFSFPWP